MRAAKGGPTFIIYATSIADETRNMSTLLEQYKSYQDVFEKKNADILPHHRPYNCAIDMKMALKFLLDPFTIYLKMSLLH